MRIVQQFTLSGGGLGTPPRKLSQQVVWNKGYVIGTSEPFFQDSLTPLFLEVSLQLPNSNQLAFGVNPLNIVALNSFASPPVAQPFVVEGVYTVWSKLVSGIPHTMFAISFDKFAAAAGGIVNVSYDLITATDQISLVVYDTTPTHLSLGRCGNVGHSDHSTGACQCRH